MTRTREKFKTVKLRRTKTDVETEKFFVTFSKKFKRPPTIFEIAYHFKLRSVSGAWERLERVKQQNRNKCLICGK